MEVLWGLLGLLAGLVAMAVGHCHRSWRLYAQFVAEWEQRATDWSESLARLEQVESSELIEMLLRHDRDGLAFARARASEWMERIPSWIRGRYLRGS